MALPSHLGSSRFLTGKGVVDVHPPPLASAFFPEWGHGKLRAAFLSLGPPGSAAGTEGQGPVGSSEGDIQSSLQHRVPRRGWTALSTAGEAGVGAGRAAAAAAPGPGAARPRCPQAARPGGRSRRLCLEPVSSAPRQLGQPLTSCFLPEPAGAGCSPPRNSGRDTHTLPVTWKMTTRAVPRVSCFSWHR